MRETHLVIDGDIASKKNSKQIFINRKTGKRFIQSSVAHQDWHTDALAQLVEKYPSQKKRLTTGQITAIEMVFYPSTRRKGDLDNKATSILDLLKDAGVIEDDNWFVIPTLFLIFGGVDRQNPRCEITIYET